MKKLLAALIPMAFVASALAASHAGAPMSGGGTTAAAGGGTSGAKSTGARRAKRDRG